MDCEYKLVEDPVVPGNPEVMIESKTAKKKICDTILDAIGHTPMLRIAKARG
jgi:hypothetical protein